MGLAVRNRSAGLASSLFFFCAQLRDGARADDVLGEARLVEHGGAMQLIEERGSVLASHVQEGWQSTSNKRVVQYFRLFINGAWVDVDELGEIENPPTDANPQRI